MQTHLVLKKYFNKKKLSQKGFSLRFLAKQLGLSAPFVSRMLSGQKPVPFAILLKLEKALDIESEVFSSLKKAHHIGPAEESVPVRGRVDVHSELQEWDLADKSKFNILRQWFYIPILEATRLADFDGTARQIAGRLGLSLTTVEVAIREMVFVGVLEEKNGQLRKSQDKLRFSSSKSLESVRRFHDQMMGRAQKELREATEDGDFQRRLITGITVTTTPQKIEAAKRKLAECLHEIANELEVENGTEIYQMAGQLFPLTKK